MAHVDRRAGVGLAVINALAPLRCPGSSLAKRPRGFARLGLDAGRRSGRRLGERRGAVQCKRTAPHDRSYFVGQGPLGLKYFFGRPGGGGPWTGSLLYNDATVPQASKAASFIALTLSWSDHGNAPFAAQNRLSTSLEQVCHLSLALSRTRHKMLP